MEELFLYGLTAISFVGFLVITIVGFRTKTAENLILAQSLPVWFMVGFLLTSLQLLEMQYPGDEGMGYGFGFFVILPSALFMIVSLTVLGALGLNKRKEDGGKLLFVSSLIAVGSTLTYMVTYLYFPLVSLFVVWTKVKRKRAHPSS